MDLLNVLQEDKELESFFLNFMNWNYDFWEIPENPKTSEELRNGKMVLNERQKSIELLLQQIVSKHNPPSKDEESLMKLMFKVCEYYENKYGEKKIRESPRFTPQFNQQYNLLGLKHLLDDNVNLCSECHSLRERMTFEDLPKKIKNRFKKGKQNVDYYLFCEKCGLYSMVGFTESFGMDEN